MGKVRISLASWFAVSSICLNVGPGQGQLEVALAVVLEEPEADIGHLLHVAADLALDLLLSRRSDWLLWTRLIDQRRLADLGRVAQHLTAIDQHGFDFAGWCAACR